MENRTVVMQELFSKLTERNKDIMILTAKSVKGVHEEPERQHTVFEQAAKPWEYMKI